MFRLFGLVTCLGTIKRRESTYLLVIEPRLCILANHLQHCCMFLAEGRHTLRRKALRQGQCFGPLFQVLAHLKCSQGPAAAQQEFLQHPTWQATWKLTHI